jgi:hypothetical protein
MHAIIETPTRLITLALLALLVSCGKAPVAEQPVGKQVTINSSPAQASVWVNGVMVGTTPQTIELPVAGEAAVRLTMRDHVDFTTTIPHTTTETELAVELVAEPRGEVVCTTVPAGAEIVLNGELRGRTPMTIRGLRPGTYQLHLRLDNYVPHDSSFDIGDDTLSHNAEIKLEDRMEVFFRRQLESDPENLKAYTDLAHHLFVSGATDEACNIVLDGLLKMAKDKENDKRLISEVDRTASGQYYREDGGVSLRKKLTDLLMARLDAKAAPTAADARAYITTLIAMKAYPQARAELQAALAFFPGDKGLKELEPRVEPPKSRSSMSPEQAAERTRILAEYKASRNAMTFAKAALLREQRRVSGAKEKIQGNEKKVAAGKQEIARVTDEIDALAAQAAAHKDDLAALAVKRGKLTADPDAAGSYQELRATLRDIANQEVETAEAQKEAEASRLRLVDALPTKQQYVKTYEKYIADARKELASAEVDLAPVEKEYAKLKERYQTAREAYYPSSKKRKDVKKGDKPPELKKLGKKDNDKKLGKKDNDKGLKLEIKVKKDDDKVRAKELKLK